MNYQDLKTYIENTALGLGTISSFIHNWVQIIDDNPKQIYPVMLLTPPTQTGRPFEDAYQKKYRITLYLFSQNVKNNGEALNSNERDEVWHGLAEIIDKFWQVLLSDRQRFALIGERELTPDEGHIGQDDLIWVKCTATLQANHLC